MNKPSHEIVLHIWGFMKFTLITTVFNEESNILLFLKSINEQTEQVDQIIIVDGGSTDSTVQLIKDNINHDIDLTIIVDESCSKKFCVGPIAKGRNVAISKARHDAILVTDAGCMLDQDWIKHMKKSFLEGAEIVSGNYMAQSGNYFQTYISDVFCPEVKVDNAKDFLPSSRSLGFKKYLWEAAGGYPETSYTAEDTLFDIKLFELTDNVVFCKEAIVYWELPIDFKDTMNKVYNYGVGEGMQKLFLYKYLIRFFLIIFPLPLLILVLLRRKKIITYPMYVAQVSGFVNGFLSSFKVK
jgi:glycosyltransferase involved in cell wall biosynthesis